MSDAPQKNTDSGAANQIEQVRAWVEQFLSEVPGYIESLADNKLITGGIALVAILGVLRTIVAFIPNRNASREAKRRAANTEQKVEKVLAVSQGHVEANQTHARTIASLIAKNAELQDRLDASSREAITDAVVSLPAQHVSQEKIKAAEIALDEGKTDLAMALYEEVAQDELARAEQQQLQSHQQAAQALRRKGALAFLNDTDEALEAYERATELDPDNAEGHNQLGLLYRRVGRLDDAVGAYERVLEIAGRDAGDDALAAVAYGNLGIVYQTRGELDKARSYWEQSLAIFEKLGSPTAEKVRGLLDGLK